MEEERRTRIQWLLDQMRATQSEALHARYAREAAVLVELEKLDRYATVELAEAEYAPDEVVFNLDEIAVALGRAQGHVDEDVLTILNRMASPDFNCREWSPGTAEEAAEWRGFTPDKIRVLADDPRISDSTEYGTTGAEDSVMLPVEQFPAKDASPEVDFDEVVGDDEDLYSDTTMAGVTVVDEFEGEIYGGDNEDVDDSIDLDDFRPPAKKVAAPETPLEKLSKDTKKKGKK